MSTDPIYQAAVYERTVSYINLKGTSSKATLYFAIDPITLMKVMAGVKSGGKRSGNPALKNAPMELSDQEQIKLILDLAAASAGWPSEDGESWEPFFDFHNNIAAKAFMTKLTSSDADRKEFSEKVILAPFEAFVEYAAADESNSPKEIQQFKTMMEQMRNIFKTPEASAESLADRRARLAAELEQLGQAEPSDES